MAAYQPVDVIEVLLWGRRIGAIAPTPTPKLYSFAYDGTWAKQKAGRIEPSPLLMPVKPGAIYQFPILAKETFLGLPPMIADALPDKFGSGLMEAWLIRKGLSKDQITPMDRLAYMAGRGMGALTFKPSRVPTGKAPDILDISEMVVQARHAMAGEIDPNDKLATSLRQLVSIGSSAGGARAKIIVAYNESTGELRSGQVSAPEGFAHWLIKLDGIDPKGNLQAPQTYGRAEYAYHLMARDAGIEMSECRLLEENGRAHFMTRRFDRDGNDRLHMQTLCAMDALDFNQTATHGYEQLFDVIKRLNLGLPAMREAFRRMVFNIAATNHDDHTKNHAFLMTPEGKWSLAPAYDVAHSNEPSSKWLQQHLMGVNGKFSKIVRADLLELAERFNINYAESDLKRVLDVVGAWASYAAKAGLPADHQSRIQKDIEAATAFLRK